MMLRTIPAVLAALLLGAHFFRAQDLPLLIASLALAATLLVPRRTVRLLCRLCLAAGVAEWGFTAWRIAQTRMAGGEPYLRMIVILGGVAAFTAAAAWLLPATARSGPPVQAEGGARRHSLLLTCPDVGSALRSPNGADAMRRVILVGLFLWTGMAASAVADDDPCVACHRGITPNIVLDWQSSRHHGAEVACATCHGDGHSSAADVARVETVTAQTCATCHDQQHRQFSKGKHALAWASYEAMPTTHALPMALGPGMKGCGGCHKIGLKEPAAVETLKKEGSLFGHASCDACHTRHTFSVTEARQPQACQTCHMGFDHPQWEMWSSSKHGVRYLLKQNGTLPDSTPAPTCQTCHMPEGNHEVRAPWGFLAVRLPLPEDPQWKADQTTILQGLGVLDPAGNPTSRLDVVKAADVARLTQEAFDAERMKMIAVCSDCHSENFARAEIAKGDDMIREIDHLMAEAIREIASLYRDGILEKPEGYAHAFPDLLTFHDAPTHLEQRLFEMHLKHRMRAFQGTFHANPDYALWYGWSEMVRDLREIREEAAHLRKKGAE